VGWAFEMSSSAYKLFLWPSIHRLKKLYLRELSPIIESNFSP
jgi:hypothetical protein